MVKNFKKINSAFFLSLKFKKINSAFLLSIFFFIFSVLIINSTESAFAQTQEVKTMYFTPQIEIPFSSISGKTAVGSVDQDGFVVSDLLARYLKAIYDYGIMVGGILAALMLMGGGLIWLTSGGDSGKVSKAKDIIAGSITGVVILFSAYLILNTINPDLVEMKGIKMIAPQDVSNRTVSCCHPQNGLMTIALQEKGGELFYADSTTGVGGKIKEKGTPFLGCWEELASEDCDPEKKDECFYDQNLKSNICIGPSKIICCTCHIGTYFTTTKHSSCLENVSPERCDEFCNEELIRYNKEDSKSYTLYDYDRISSGLYTCEPSDKGDICEYTGLKGKEW